MFGIIAKDLKRIIFDFNRWKIGRTQSQAIWTGSFDIAASAWERSNELIN